MGITEGYIPKRYEAAPGGTGAGGGGNPFVLRPSDIPPGMAQVHLTAPDGREMDFVGPPSDLARITQEFYAQGTAATPAVQPTPAAAPVVATTRQPAQPVTRTEPAAPRPPEPPTRPVRTTRAPLPRARKIPATATQPPVAGQPETIVQQPAAPVALDADGTTDVDETQVVVEPLPTQPGWVRRTYTRIRRARSSTERVVGAFLLGALLTGAGVAIYSETDSKPTDGTITNSFSIPIGQCENVPGNSIALGYFLTVNGVTYNPEKDPNEGVAAALNSPAEVCTSTDDKQPTLVVVVSDGQASLYRRFAQDINQMQDNGCINNSGCRRVIAVVK